MKPKRKANTRGNEFHSILRLGEQRSFYDKLIPLVRESAIIYDRKHPYYGKYKAHRKQWEMIAKKVGKTGKDWIFYDAMRFLEGHLVRYNKGNPPRKPSKPVAADDTTTDDTSMDDVTSNDETTNEESSSEHSEEEKSNEDDLEAVEAVKEEIFQISDESNNLFTISEVQGNVSLPPLANEQLEISAGAPPVLLPNHPTEDIVSSPSSIHHPNHNQVVQEASSSSGSNSDMQHISKSWKPFMEMIVSQLAKVPENRVFEFQVEILKLISDKLNDYNN
uniref:MADF domain-containing protein n=1 Tax=Lutzomyia longipalpis TaxID=7200 RepID=A0A1B0GLR0_LUTLO